MKESSFLSRNFDKRPKRFVLVMLVAATMLTASTFAQTVGDFSLDSVQSRVQSIFRTVDVSVNDSVLQQVFAACRLDSLLYSVTGDGLVRIDGARWEMHGAVFVLATATLLYLLRASQVDTSEVDIFKLHQYCVSKRIPNEDGAGRVWLPNTFCVITVMETRNFRPEWLNLTTMVAKANDYHHAGLAFSLKQAGH